MPKYSALPRVCAKNVDPCFLRLCCSGCHPACSPQPKLALISDFPASYTGPTANLSASSATATCVEAPSARFNTSNVTLVSPGEGLCNGNGNMPPGAYNNFTQIAPPGTVFVGWQCYAIDTVNGVTTLVSSGMNPVIGLSNNDFITCKANYSLAPRYDSAGCSDPEHSSRGCVCFGVVCAVLLLLRGLCALS